VATVITTAEAKTHLRVFHSLDDAYIGTLCTVAQEEWESVTKMLLDSQGTEQSIRFDEAPADGLFRFYNWPVKNTAPNLPYFVGFNAVTTTFTVSQFREIDLWQAIDARSQIEDGTLVFPGTLYYRTLYTSATTPQSIRHCLLMRIGSLYSYRGDDVNPPNLDQWLMLAARWRKGGLL